MWSYYLNSSPKFFVCKLYRAFTRVCIIVESFVCFSCLHLMGVNAVSGQKLCPHLWSPPQPSTMPHVRGIQYIKKKKNSLTIFKRGCGALKNLVLAHCLSICPYLILWRCKCFYFSCSNCMSFTQISWCYMCAVLRCSVVSNSLWPHGLLPTRLLCPWNFPGKNTGMGCHFLLQGIFLTQGSNLCLLHFLHWQADSLPLSHLGSKL